MEGSPWADPVAALVTLQMLIRNHLLFIDHNSPNSAIPPALGPWVRMPSHVQLAAETPCEGARCQLHTSTVSVKVLKTLKETFRSPQ